VSEVLGKNEGEKMKYFNSVFLVLMILIIAGCDNQRPEKSNVVLI